MREDNSRFIFESIEALEVPIALLTADGKVRYANRACWQQIFEVADGERQIPRLDYFALALVGLEAEKARQQLGAVLSGTRRAAEAAVRSNGTDWRICFCRYTSPALEGVMVWHWRSH